ncbi:HemK methyltransferase member 1 [Halocaridina rubra]|uniref:peptide chain release factor N(5)-glutamine methyltransferase n=1 Tax=Halocaridina rubra TaxID=373956 RepID=A0AAN8XUW9_HALRR
MLPSVAVLIYNTSGQLTSFPVFLPVIVKKLNSLLQNDSNVGCQSHSRVMKDEIQNSLSRKKLLIQHMKRCSHIKQCAFSGCNSGLLSKRNAVILSNKKFLRGAKNALLKHAPHRCKTDCSFQCRSYVTKTVNEALVDWTEKLEGAAVPEARLSAEYIIAHILRVPRKELNVLGGSGLSEDVLCEAERLLTCRMTRMPLQYIIGDWDFHSVTIKVRPPVFIPRPETEQLVDLALECLRGVQAPRVLDIGCGSGAISLALIKNISDLKCVAMDHSRHAIELTEENASLLGVRQRLTVVHGKVTMDRLPKLPYDEFDLIVSNPPYVLRKDLMSVQPEIMIYEDMRALDGGKDGLEVIKPILTLFQHLLPVGNSLLLEIDPCHQYLLPEWMKTQKSMKLKLSDVIEDYSGKARFVKLVRIS